MDFKIKLFYTFAALLRIGKNCYVVLRIAQVAELVDALDSKSSFFGSAGSIPALSTDRKPKRTFRLFCFQERV